MYFLSYKCWFSNKLSKKCKLQQLRKLPSYTLTQQQQQREQLVTGQAGIQQKPIDHWGSQEGNVTPSLIPASPAASRRKPRRCYV